MTVKMTKSESLDAMLDATVHWNVSKETTQARTANALVTGSSWIYSSLNSLALPVVDPNVVHWFDSSVFYISPQKERIRWWKERQKDDVHHLCPSDTPVEVLLKSNSSRREDKLNIYTHTNRHSLFPLLLILSYSMFYTHSNAHTT